MKTQGLAISIVSLNVALILFIAARPATETFDKISVREFELVDKNGKERASIKIESNGEVVVRLRDANGTIRVKVGAGEAGSGFVFLDDATEAAIHGTAGKEGPKLTLTDKAGKKREY